MEKINLVCFDLNKKKEFTWQLGKIFFISPDPQSVFNILDKHLTKSGAEAWLFWDPALGEPDPKLMLKLLEEPADVWHAGLKLGFGGKPNFIDYISPTWTFNRDPSPNIEAISWRLSLSACLIKTSVLRELGHIDLAFETLEFAGLEMGYRYIWRGAVIVNTPSLISINKTIYRFENAHDTYIFLHRHYQQLWVKYLLCRRFLSSGNLIKEIKAYRAALGRVLKTSYPITKDQVLTRKVDEEKPVSKPKVSVLIPTIYRYAYLGKTLSYLENQTVKPDEIICVDQTPEDKRKQDFYSKFPNLNIKVIWLDEPGQCSARNAGLKIVTGDLILFMDDDVIIGEDYLQSLINGLSLYQADIAQGVWDQSTGEALAPMDRHYRISDRFATGNGIATREVLSRVGGFDLNYNRNYRADADLGMRLYLAGAISIIVPEAKEHSLSPPTGGLKFYKASGAINRIHLLKPWPQVTQVYYWLRYFNSNQVKEALIILLLSTLVHKNITDLSTKFDNILFKIKSIIKFPLRAIGVLRSVRKAKNLLVTGPKIPPFQISNCKSQNINEK